ncbi:MAG: hypothetical protein ACKVZH_09255 [Blastocatellia bacterium]
MMEMQAQFTAAFSGGQTNFQIGDESFASSIHRLDQAAAWPNDAAGDD